MSRRPSADWWFGFGVRFVCGALLGALLGLSLWLALAYGSPHGWLLVAACALAVGLASGLWGDAFWHGLRDWLWWWT